MLPFVPTIRLVVAGTLLLPLFACRTAVPPPAAPPLATTPEFQGVAAQSMKILDAYWSKTPDQGMAPPLRLVYFVAADRDPLPRYQERITGWFDDFQDFFRSEFTRNGYGPRELLLERNADGMVRLHLVKGKKKDADYSYKSGGGICREAREALKGTVDFDRETVLIINALSKTEEGKIKLYAPYYGLGLGDQMKGTALVVDQELLDIPNLAAQDRKVTIAEHQDRMMSLADYNTTYIGGTLHELGHALSLPHDFQTGAEKRRGVPLMGAGNYTYRNDRHGQSKVTYLSFAESTRLLSQPLFSRRTCERETMATVSKGVLFFSTPGGVTVSGSLSSAVPVYAVVAYLDQDGEDSAHKDDYDANTFVTAPDNEGRVYLTIPNIPKGQGWLRLVFCHANGSTSMIYKTYQNAGDGSAVVLNDPGRPSSSRRQAKPDAEAKPPQGK